MVVSGALVTTVSLLLAAPLINAGSPIFWQPYAIASSAMILAYFAPEAISYGRRQTIAAFDSTGELLQVRIFAMNAPAESATLGQVIEMVSGPPAIGNRVRVDLRRAEQNSLARGDSAAIAPAVSLDSTDMSRIRELARWFWVHRCHTENPDSRSTMQAEAAPDVHSHSLGDELAERVAA